MTPLEIEMLIHYYAKADDYRNGDFTATAVREAIDKFIRLGLLKRNAGPNMREYGRTEALDVYMTALRAVPAPIQKWVMPDLDREAA